jgi:hypothetical protein
MSELRPIDEIPATATLAVRRNQAMTWLVDGQGIEYRPPDWLVRLVNLAERAGFVAAQAAMRDALGLCECSVTLMPTGVKIETPARSETPVEIPLSESSEAEQHPNVADRKALPGDHGGLS